MNDCTTDFVVYKITNTLNGKIYVGVTTRGIKKRFYEHVHASKNDTPKYVISQAIKKYGAQNFRIEVIEYCTDKEHMQERERFWIRELDSFNPKNGYNCTAGGDGPSGIVGSMCANAKLNETIVEQIKVLYIDGLSLVDIKTTLKLDCKKTLLWNIVHLQTWKHVRPDLNDKLIERYGKRQISDVTRKRMSEAHIGKKMSEASRMKMSRASDSRFRSISNETASIIKFDKLHKSAKEYSELYHISRTQVWRIQNGLTYRDILL